MDILLLPPPESRQVAWWLVLNHKNCQACRRSMSELGLVSQGRAPGTRNHDVLNIANPLRYSPLSWPPLQRRCVPVIVSKLNKAAQAWNTDMVPSVRKA